MNTQTPIRLGILGLGTVGGGTVKVLQRNAEEISRRIGRPIEVAIASVRQLDGERLCDTRGIHLTTQPEDVVKHSDVDIVVELMGGESMAKQLVMSAIKANKHVVTANKALIALHGNEIFAAAQRQGVSVLFEAAVAGGIDIIKGLREGMAGNQIELVAGIINGTGNYILTQMRDQGSHFADALAQAQELGYAEADPTYDVEGIDAAHKLSILAAIAFGTPIAFAQVYTEGISTIDLLDVAYAKELGYQIKHLGIARPVGEDNQALELRVHPTLIPEKRLIANVDGVMNAILVRGDAVGNTLRYGAGAGAEPTASAVVADIVDLSRALASDHPSQVPHLAFQSDALKARRILPPNEFVSTYYLRITVNDVPGVMSKLSTVFAKLGVSIEAILQKEPRPDQQHVAVVFLTQRTLEGTIDKAIEQLESMPDVRESITRIRVEHLDS